MRTYTGLLSILTVWPASPQTTQKDLFLPMTAGAHVSTKNWVGGSSVLDQYGSVGMDFEGEALSGYRKIRLVAWSLGVWAASVMFGKKPVSFTEAIASTGLPAPFMTGGVSRKRSSGEHWIT